MTMEKHAHLQMKSTSQSNGKQVYKKLSHVEHVYELPDSYVGSVDPTEIETYVINESDEVLHKKIVFVPALYKIYDEILVNAEDQYVRMMNTTGFPVSHIDISIDVEQQRISVMNDGEGIEIKKMKEYNKYPAEMIFGELLTSSNYNKDEDKVTGGKNGYGAKLTNIFSKEFIVETVDAKRKLHFKQTFTNNMRTKSPPVITKYGGPPFTQITFVPDLERFGLSGIDADMLALMKKRAYDIAAWTNDTVKVTYNGRVIQCANFEEYASMFLGPESVRPRVYKKFNRNWEIIATYNDKEVFEQISFVNGINTIRGGKHVDYVANQICKQVAEYLCKKKKLNIKPIYVKNQLMVFVKATIVNPSFDGQTKETLTTAASKFGSTCTITTKFIQDLLKTGIEDRIVQHAEYKNSKSLKKTDGKKMSNLKGIPKLCDANKAGGRYSKKCTLILTEGDSAKTMAIAGLSEVGRDYYGVFPLRGKLLNVKDADISQIVKNAEISNIKKILGLKSGEVYSDDMDTWPLRYGKLIIMTDQDVDGSHIKGLVMNVFHSHWRSLLQMDFVASLLTPIVKVTKGKKKFAFYTLTDYEKWKSKNNSGKGWRVKYYKGLGTSTTKEAKEYFKRMKLVNYNWDSTYSDNAIDLAFNKSRSDDRKDWLNAFDRAVVLDSKQEGVTYDEFIHKDFIHFSNYNLIRSIPSLVDGMKPSQRKIMFSCFKRNLSREIKVAQLAGYVSENAAYHHGEVSLQDTIVGLAQDFVGSNNLNLLLPNGTFGSRLQGGKDSASARYIYTCLNPLTTHLFKKEDAPLLKYLDDDGQSIEPEFYVPILPTLLMNGAKGIGTGYSTSIPMYNPADIVANLKARLAGKETKDLAPWFRDFNGKVACTTNTAGKKSWYTKGKYEIVNANTIRVTELPIGTWTEKYKEFLESILVETSKAQTKKRGSKKKILKSYVDHSTDAKVDLTLKFDYKDVLAIRKEATVDGVNGIERTLRLVSKKATNMSNMHLYNTKGFIRKYTCAQDIIDEFYEYRLELYRQRRLYQLDILQKEMRLIDERVRFIMEMIAGTIDLRNKKHAEVEEMLTGKSYPRLGGAENFDYLIKMSLSTLTQEKVDELREECATKRSQLTELQDSTPQQIWDTELDVFMVAYKTVMRKRAAENRKRKKRGASKR